VFKCFFLDNSIKNLCKFAPKGNASVASTKEDEF
jgi:hypothetical protein